MGGRGGGGRGHTPSGGGGRWHNPAGGGRGHNHGGNTDRRKGQGNVKDNRENVNKFLTYYKRTKSICIDLYSPAFYKRKPHYDELADFVYDILCPSDNLRAALDDVQLHPVKKHLLIKFNTVESRDTVAGMLSGDGLEWPEFSTKVQGWAMDKPVVFVRVLGASPLTTKDDIKQVMEQYGEVIEIKKGFLSNKLPNVTNGTWTVRMVVGADQTIPSFVFVKEDGEIWQLAHDSQMKVCWKCGGQDHIGSRCREQAVSLDEDLAPGVEDQQGGGAPAQTWAHVVRRGAALHGGVGGQEAVAKEAAAKEAAAKEAAAKEAAAKAVAAKDAAAAKKAAAKEAAAREATAKEVAVREDAAKEATAKEKSVEEAATKEAAVKEAAATRVAGSKEVEVGPENELQKQEDLLRRLKEVEIRREEDDAVTNKVSEAEQEKIPVNNAGEDDMFDEGVVAESMMMVTMSAPIDSVLPPVKLSKLTSGLAVSSCDVQLGSSPNLHHKDARDGQQSLEDMSSIGVVVEPSSLFGSSISPNHSATLETQPGSLEPFSDTGSSNANRPDTPMQESEKSD